MSTICSTHSSEERKEGERKEILCYPSFQHNDVFFSLYIFLFVIIAFFLYIIHIKPAYLIGQD